VELLSDSLQKFLEAARKRPELAAVNSTFRAGVPQVYADVGPRQGDQAGSGGGRRLPDAAGLPGRPLREPVQPLRPPVARVPPVGGRRPPGPGGHRELLRPQQRRGHAAALDRRARPGASSVRSTRSASTCSAPCRSPASPLPATARARPWPRSRKSRTRCCLRDGLRLGGPLVPGAARRGPGGDRRSASPSGSSS
jgi:hypothetical protein